MDSIFDSALFNQNLFFPRCHPRSQLPGSDDIYIEVEPGIRVHTRRYLNSEAKLSLLYFHGNGEIVYDYDMIYGQFNELAVEFVVCDYRGYGSSEGKPTLRTILADAHCIYKYLREQNQLLDKVVVMGRSLGSAPAIELAAHNTDLSGCVVESGYADPVALARRRGIDIARLGDEEAQIFDNSVKITRVTCPLLIMHGAMDTLIVPEEAEQNFRCATSEDKHLEIIAGAGHNNIMMVGNGEYFRCLGKFLRGIVG